MDKVTAAAASTTIIPASNQHKQQTMVGQSGIRNTNWIGRSREKNGMVWNYMDF